MKPAPFRYARPGTVVEAVGLLATHGPGARLLAGGQSLVPLLVRRVERPALIVDINRIAGLDQIELLPAWVRMGALVRQEQALRSPLVCREVAGLAQAMAWVANPVIRLRGTLVGNLVTNGPGAELPAVALALGAQFVVRQPRGERIVPAAGLLGPDQVLAPDAMVTHVLWPRRAARAGFFEVARREGHAPVVSSLVTLVGADCRVSLSGVCRTGLSCPGMARVIAQLFPRLPPAAALAEALRQDLTAPLYGDAHSSADYRLEVAAVVSQRAARLMAAQAAAA